MKKLLALLLTMLLLTAAAAAEGILPFTDLDAVKAKLADGITLDRVFYTDGTAYISQFVTADPEETARLWDAVCQIRVGDPAAEPAAGRSPQILFFLSDGTMAGAGFDGNCLRTEDGVNYTLEDDEAFWSLTAELVEKYAGTEAGGPVDGGWGAASDPTVTDDIRALVEQATEGMNGIRCVPVAYLGMQIVAGYEHTILCQVTYAYPDAQPFWAVLYLFEDLDGGAAVFRIRELDI